MLLQGVGETAIQIGELLPSLVSPAVDNPTTAVEDGGGYPHARTELMVRAFQEQNSSAVHVVVVNMGKTAINATIGCSAITDNATEFYTPFVQNASYVTNFEGRMIVFSQPLEVQVFRLHYPWASLGGDPTVAHAESPIWDAFYENYELHAGFPKYWFINVYQNDRYMSHATAMGETRPGFVRSPRRHSLRLTRADPIPSKSLSPPFRPDAIGDNKCQMLVPFAHGIANGSWSLSIWHRTAPGATALGINTTVYIPLPYATAFVAKETWSQLIIPAWKDCGQVNHTCMAALEFLVPFGGQLWLDQIEVVSARSDLEACGGIDPDTGVAMPECPLESPSLLGFDADSMDDLQGNHTTSHLTRAEVTD